MSQSGDRPPCPLLLQQGTQLIPHKGDLQAIACHCTCLTGHGELLSAVPACWIQHMQQALGLILETAKEALSLLESVLLYPLMSPPAGRAGT